MRIELVFELKKPELPKDNKSIWISFLKKIISNCNHGKYYERYFSEAIAKDYAFSVIFSHPNFGSEKIILSDKYVKMIFAADDRGKTGLIFYAAFLEYKNQIFNLPDDNAMTLKKITMKKEPVFEESNMICRTVTGGGLVIRDHNRENNRDYYYTMDDKEFIEKAERVFKDQLVKAGFSLKAAENLKFLPLKFKSVLVPQYNAGVIVNIGVFQLKGNPEILRYFYQAGIGSKHSMGYGLIEILA